MAVEGGLLTQFLLLEHTQPVLWSILIFSMCSDDCSWSEIDLFLTTLLSISLSGEYISPNYSEQITL